MYTLQLPTSHFNRSPYDGINFIHICLFAILPQRTIQYENSRPSLFIRIGLYSTWSCIQSMYFTTNCQCPQKFVIKWVGCNRVIVKKDFQKDTTRRIHYNGGVLPSTVVPPLREQFLAIFGRIRTYSPLDHPSRLLTWIICRASPARRSREPPSRWGEWSRHISDSWVTGRLKTRASSDLQIGKKTVLQYVELGLEYRGL